MNEETQIKRNEKKSLQFAGGCLFSSLCAALQVAQDKQSKHRMSLPPSASVFVSLPSSVQQQPPPPPPPPPPRQFNHHPFLLTSKDFFYLLLLLLLLHPLSLLRYVCMLPQNKSTDSTTVRAGHSLRELQGETDEWHMSLHNTIVGTIAASRPLVPLFPPTHCSHLTHTAAARLCVAGDSQTRSPRHLLTTVMYRQLTSGPIPTVLDRCAQSMDNRDMCCSKQLSSVDLRNGRVRFSRCAYVACTSWF